MSDTMQPPLPPRNSHCYQLCLTARLWANQLRHGGQLVEDSTEVRRRQFEAAQVDELTKRMAVLRLDSQQQPLQPAESECTDQRQRQAPTEPGRCSIVREKSDLKVELRQQETQAPLFHGLKRTFIGFPPPLAAKSHP
ncbi:hypothetical protein BOX15_Mlig011999g1 [Macrostomum lignano]|uniref:Uncharacterized protein n=1 Tax=Macrostomum lignano TaxID=282301 RepID=A0A267F4U3_9PLAT|nr:hypothetical protein BOX15_Mlig011999g1 [Macrostomum lignano]